MDVNTLKMRYRKNDATKLSFVYLINTLTHALNDLKLLLFVLNKIT